MYRAASLAVTVLSLPALLLWVHLVVGWGALLAPWRTLGAADLGVLVGASLVSYAARALRIYDYFHPVVGHAPLATVRLSLLHNLFNNLLPMRAGEAAFPLLMKRYFGEGYLRSSVSLLWLRVLDLAVLMGAGFAVLLVADPFEHVPAAAFGAGLALVACGLVVLPLLRGLYARLSATAPLPLRLLREVLANLPASAAGYWRVVALSMLAWGGKLLAFVWLAVTMTGLPLAQAFIGVAAGELSSVLPVHGLAGSGTYEGAMVGALVLTGASQELALLAAVNVHLFLLGIAIVFGIAARALPVPRASAAGTSGARGGTAIG